MRASTLLALLALVLPGCLPDTDLEPPETSSTGEELITDSDGSFAGERELRDDDDLLLIDSDGRIDRDDPY